MQTNSPQLTPGPFTLSFEDDNEEAMYHQLVMMMQLKHVNSKEFERIANGDIDLNNYLSAGTFKHELTHFIDQIATLQGQRNLVLMFNAFNAWTIRDEKQFYWIKKLYDSIKKDSFANYFSEVNQPDNASFAEPWTYEVTSGLRFDTAGHLLKDTPILFLRFFDQLKKPIARTPICVAALHETNAVFADYTLRSDFIQTIEDTTVKEDELEEMSLDMEELFYSTDTCLYSAAAHLIEKTNGINDFFPIYKLTSSLGTLALNLPEDLVKKMKQIPFPHDEWQRRFSSMTANCDIGYTFYRLNENMIAEYGPDQYTIERVLKASELPDQVTLELKVVEAMLFNMRKLTSGPFTDYGTMLINYGINVFSKRGLDGQKPGYEAWIKEEKPFPKIILADTTFPQPEKSLNECLSSVVDNGFECTLEEHFKAFTYLNEKFNEFVEVCGI